MSGKSIYKAARRGFARLLERFMLSRRRRFHLLTVLIGVLSGLSAVAFHQSIHWAEKSWIYRIKELPGWMGIAGLILLPALGGLVVGLILKHWAPEAAGSGIPQTKAAYFMKFGRIRFRTAAAKFLLGTISIGTGASLGREGPTVQISAAIASWIGRWFNLSSRQVMSLIPLGCAGGIAAAFNTPLAAIVFAIEEIMGDMKRSAFAGIVVVAVIAAVIERSILGSSAMFTVPEHPEFLSLPALGWALALGVFAGFVSHAFVEALLSVRERVKSVRSGIRWMMPGLGGLGTGCIGAFIYVNFDRMGVFGIGYEDLSAALFGKLGVGVLAVLFVGKILATTLSYSTGGSGGVFAPTLFIGAMLGGLVGGAASYFGDYAFPLKSTLAIVGMGAMFAGTIRAPVTSILIIFELTRSYSLILPIMLANLTAYVIAGRLRELPLYEALLLQDGVNLRKFPILRPSLGWQNMPISSIMTSDVHFLRANQPLWHAYEKIKDDSHKIFPVLDDNERYVGLIHRKGIQVVGEKEPDKLVREIFISKTFPKVYPDQRIREVAKMFVSTEWMTLPVVSRLDESRVVGVVTLHDLTRQQFLQDARGDES